LTLPSCALAALNLNRIEADTDPRNRYLASLLLRLAPLTGALGDFTLPWRHNLRALGGAKSGKGDEAMTTVRPIPEPSPQAEVLAQVADESRPMPSDEDVKRLAREHHLPAAEAEALGRFARAVTKIAEE
jgi:hypothetical protein